MIKKVKATEFKKLYKAGVQRSNTEATSEARCVLDNLINGQTNVIELDLTHEYFHGKSAKSACDRFNNLIKSMGIKEQLVTVRRQGRVFVVKREYLSKI